MACSRLCPWALSFAQMPNSQVAHPCVLSMQLLLARSSKGRHLLETVSSVPIAHLLPCQRLPAAP